MESCNLFEGAEVIYAYTRAQALEDGELVDVSSTAREAGIRFPVALTRAVWSECVELPDGYHGSQDERGRLWDVVWMLRCSVGRARNGQDEIRYTVLVRRVNQDGSDDQRGTEAHRLKALCHGGDNGEPVITVMLPEED